MSLLRARGTTGGAWSHLGRGDIFSAHLCVPPHYLGPCSPFSGCLCLIVPHVGHLSAESFRWWPVRTRPPPLPPARGPNVRRRLMRTAILLAIYLNPCDFGSQAWSGPVSTEVGDHLGTLGAVRFFARPFPAHPAVHPTTPPSVPIPPLPPNVHTWHICRCVRPCSWRPPSTPNRRLRCLEFIFVYG